MSNSTLEEQIRKESKAELTGTVLFLVCYFLLILLGFALFGGMIWGTIKLFPKLLELHLPDYQFVLVLLLWTALLWFCIQISWHLVKPLFTFHKINDPEDMEISSSDCPELFDTIGQVAKATGSDMPKHVFLRSNAVTGVFYNTTSIWSIFFPASKNLTIGMATMKGLNTEEFKSILAHEFGHFSQQSMKMNNVNYRLVLIINDMMKMSDEQQDRSILNRSNDFGLFHLAKGPIRWITKLTIALYTHIENRHRRLSRLMEYEADTIACRVVGAAPFISSLIKLEVNYARHPLFEEFVQSLIQEGRLLQDYWAGYDALFEQQTKADGIEMTYMDTFTELMGDNALFPTRVSEWDRHPNLNDRLKNARQYLTEAVFDPKSDADTLIPDGVKAKVGDRRLKMLSNNQQLTAFSPEEFSKWIEERYSRYLSIFISPFVANDVPEFELPTSEEMSEPVSSPFTVENRMLLIEMNTCFKDQQLLDSLQQSRIGLEYDGKECEVKTALKLHEEYTATFVDRNTALNRQIYTYLWQRAKNRTALNLAYWAIPYCNRIIGDLNGITAQIQDVNRQVQIFKEHGRDFSPGIVTHNRIAHDMWVFLQSLDYNNLSRCCGGWGFGDGKVDVLLKNWQAFASQKSVPSISTNDLFTMHGHVYGLFSQVYDYYKHELAYRIDRAYIGVEETEAPEPEVVP